MTWAEEARQIDGKVITVQREITLGARSAGQGPQILTNSLIYQAGADAPEVRFTSEFDKNIGSTDFRILGFYILDGSAYVFTRPYLCNSYNKWMRPNPPYIVFRLIGGKWMRTPFEEVTPKLPLDSNLYLGIETTETIYSALNKAGVIDADTVASRNTDVRIPSYISIRAEKLSPGEIKCGELITNGRGTWVPPQMFSGRKNLTECVEFCTSADFDRHSCPCNRMFKE